MSHVKAMKNSSLGQKWIAACAASLGMLVVSCGTDVRHTASAAPPSAAGSDHTEQALEVLTVLASAKSFRDLKEIEALLGAKASLVLDAPPFLRYEIRGGHTAWFVVVRVLAQKQDSSRLWVRSIEAQPRSACIPERRLALMWASTAGIPVEKSFATRDALQGWVLARDIPHLTDAAVWTYHPSPNRTITYWIRDSGQTACAAGFSFSFSRTTQD